ncbi:hypothetical protein [Kallotenue papyrolyticum]|uniref:hypothetical protein n=1 Tax=Kallotenue papyrolyticum TaxID=1325125 RepID=UPI0004786440|nr:hypothetical protein [Kallotenue papyrolyticum]
MAINQRMLPLYAARLRRAQLPVGYFKLGETGLLLGAVVVVCLLSILYLAQTGRVASAGYRLQALEQEHIELLREAEQYEFRIAQASRLDVIAARAEQLGLRPASGSQLQYATIELPTTPAVASKR